VARRMLQDLTQRVLMTAVEFLYLRTSCHGPYPALSVR
jgi:hypothetical protein